MANEMADVPPVGRRYGQTPGIANAGAPDAGVRCPETRIVEGEPGSCPWCVLSNAPGPDLRSETRVAPY